VKNHRDNALWGKKYFTPTPFGAEILHSVQNDKFLYVIIVGVCNTPLQRDFGTNAVTGAINRAPTPFHKKINTGKRGKWEIKKG
jgi:hypothetical protein